VRRELQTLPSEWSDVCQDKTLLTGSSQYSLVHYIPSATRHTEQQTFRRITTFYDALSY